LGLWKSDSDILRKTTRHYFLVRVAVGFGKSDSDGAKNYFLRFGKVFVQIEKYGINV
tara:strand:- start:1053 stop:1223 length:171 start_codon:yes stop_codon:yes gene_type:complete